jgi:hypothetical protein
MPKDAVDLVVEDPDAAIQEMEQNDGMESRSSRLGLESRRFIEGSTTRVPHAKLASGLETCLIRCGSRFGMGSDSPWGGEAFSQPRETGVTIVRETEPPPRARVEMSIVGYRGMIPTHGRKIFRALRACTVIHESIIRFICSS